MTPPPPIRWMTDLDTHQNNNRRIGKRHNENQREWRSGRVGATERNREIRKQRQDERTESKTVGAAFFVVEVYRN